MILQEHGLYHIITYGCQMNEYDSEKLAGQLESIGYVATVDVMRADIVLVNTCCVRESAEKKIYGKLGELKRLKMSRPGLIIGVCGCMAQKEQGQLLQKAPYIDFVVGPDNINQVAKIVTEIKSHQRHVLAVDKLGTAPVDVPVVRAGDKVKAWVPIMYGCNNFCTYCIVPYVRGRERSRPLDEILREVAALGQAGFKEVTLLGQNVNSYGCDGQDGVDFAGLLRAVDKIDMIERVRYMTSHPKDMTDAVIQAVRDGRHICEHFHLPVQAGSDTILAKMNRGYTTDYYASLVERIRRAIPDASITTDLIVGFPGETDELFAETLAFVEKIKFDAAFTFIYSPRSGTPAANMPGQVPLAVKKQRLAALMAVQNKISLAINQTLIGKTVEVLVEGRSKHDPTKLTGRTRTNKIVIWDDNKVPAGSLVPITITQAQTWVLKGKPVA